MNNFGLVLEGGGMKGMFTAGVLDYFLEQDLSFGQVIGVSAGAIHACSYLSKQKHRSRDITLTYIKDHRYCSWKNVRKTGDMFEKKFVYYDIPEKYFPFDHQTFNKSKTKLLVGVTDIVKGKAKYIEIKTFAGGQIEALRASASLPMISNPVKFRGKEYLDGGVSESIPLKKIEEDGFEKNVVILTKAKGHRKKKSYSYLLTKRRYKKYPKLIELIKNRHDNYNQTMQYVEQQEKAGNTFVIRPPRDVVKRLDKNIDKLKQSYEDGYMAAKNIFPELLKFLKINENNYNK